MYPNPAKDLIIIDYTLSDDSDIRFVEIYDLQGKIVKSINLNKNKDIVSIDISQLLNGDYLIYVCCSKSNKYVKQISVNH